MGLLGPVPFYRIGDTMAERFKSEMIKEKDNAVKILIEKGADPNTHDDEGRNGMMLMSMESLNGNSGQVTIETRQTIELRLRFRRLDKVVELIGEKLVNEGWDIKD